MRTDLDAAKIYTDMNGLDSIRSLGRSDKKAALKEIAQQFESVFLQLVMKSMRAANKSFKSDLFESNQMDFYQDMYDKQITLHLSKSGVGLSEMLVKQFSQMDKMIKGEDGKSAITLDHSQLVTRLKQIFNNKETLSAANLVAADGQDAKNKRITHQDLLTDFFSSKPKFVQYLWTGAKVAARALGLNPKVLIAQAALETNWGKQVIRHQDGQTSFNLFGIKADPAWNKEKVLVSTLEYRDGVARQEKASFRSYKSFGESFIDYVNFLISNPRYKQALQQTKNPQDFTKALQEAGYATDPKYADKINSIMNSSVFKDILK